MAIAKRVFLFLVVNLLVIVTISVISSVFGLHRMPQFPGMIAFCALWGFGGAFISLLLSKTIAKWSMKVKLIDPLVRDPAQKELVETVHGLARRAGLNKMPEVGIYDSPEMNAFATGPSKNNSLVAVSSGLLRSMNKNEVEGVLGHEIAHIANGDMVTMTLIQGVVNSFVLFLSRIIAGFAAQFVRDEIRGIVHIVAVLVLDIAFTILGSMVTAYYSRTREFRADSGGAKYAGKDKMVAALKALQSRFEPYDEGEAAQAMQAFKINSQPKGWLHLFSTHPSLKLRIEKLERARV
ncbi:MAG: protease HtpX [Bdellovibrionales bacterium CG10_big_fil_rev_8_21_14_0_10_45_34]|nr:MAG: protease HtpX [Bdellovibrionales bacterium CG10_big_fil_rev_8_21_14_0_10_45_34]